MLSSTTGLRNKSVSSSIGGGSSLNNNATGLLLTGRGGSGVGGNVVADGNSSSIGGGLSSKTSSQLVTNATTTSISQSQSKPNNGTATILSGSSGGGMLNATTTANNTMNGRIGRSNKGTTNRNTSNMSQKQQQQQRQFFPKLITSQIIALQCFHYFILSLFFQINHVLYGTTITIDRIFTDQYLGNDSGGLYDKLAIIISSLAGSFLLAIIVEKSKKCLDFSCTLFLVHLFLCTCYSGHIPSRSDWWIIHITGTIIMIVLGEYLCSRRELDDIPLLQI